MADITVDGHERSALYGSGGLGWHTFCACGERCDGLSRGEVIDAHEQHLARLTLTAPTDKPGPAKCRAALARATAAGKPTPPATELETSR